MDVKRILTRCSRKENGTINLFENMKHLWQRWSWIPVYTLKIFVLEIEDGSWEDMNMLFQKRKCNNQSFRKYDAFVDRVKVNTCYHSHFLCSERLKMDVKRILTQVSIEWPDHWWVGQYPKWCDISHYCLLSLQRTKPIASWLTPQSQTLYQSHMSLEDWRRTQDMKHSEVRQRSLQRTETFAKLINTRLQLFALPHTTLD